MSDRHHFMYHGERYSLFYHMYNLTHLNERCVEMAIATRWLDQFNKTPWKLDAGLEVGNVTGHYSQRRHAVWDLHEKPAWYQVLGGQKVVSADILNYVAMFAYPWVLSISTIEHTEDPVQALWELRSLVEPGGKLLVTFPMGERGELDEVALSRAEETFDRYCTIERRVNGHGDWEQTSHVEWRAYGPWANSVFIGEWERPA